MKLAGIIIASALALGSCGARNSVEAEPLPSAHDAGLRRVLAALDVLPADTKASIEKAILASPDSFLELLAAADKESLAAGDLLILVDKKNALPPDYEPNDLVSINGWGVSVTRKDLRLRECIMEPSRQMASAAKAEGIDIIFASSYRSYEYQDGLFKRYAASYGEEEASRFSARPGTSQHQLGTVIDFFPIDDTFAESKAGRWMEENAWRYGFSRSFPQGMEEVTGYVWESWHFRYITKPGVLLERDYFEGIQQFFLEFLAAYRMIGA